MREKIITLVLYVLFYLISTYIMKLSRLVYKVVFQDSIEQPWQYVFVYSSLYLECLRTRCLCFSEKKLTN